MEKMGQRIRELREKRGITLEKLGELIGVNKSAVLKYENGTVINIPILKLKSIAKALNTTVAYLIGEQESTYTDVNVLSKEELEQFNIIKNTVFFMIGKNLTLKQKNDFEDILLYYYSKSIKN